MTAVAVAMLAAPQTPAAQSPEFSFTIRELMDRSASYMKDAFTKLSTVVCEENYVQESNGRPAVSRRLASDLLLVRHPVETESWMVFRDIISVDGRPVPGRSNRLIELFVEPTNDSYARARAIAADGERYHIVKPPALVANPMFGPGVLQVRYRYALRFILRGLDAEIGPGAAVVDFEERPAVGGAGTILIQRPPVLGPHGGSGRAWIEPDTGRVVKTDVRVGVDEGRNTTTFIRDTRLGIDRPVEMRTSWPTGAKGVTVTGVATYAQCRRFGVETTEAVQ